MVTRLQNDPPSRVQTSNSATEERNLAIPTSKIRNLRDIAKNSFRPCSTSFRLKAKPIQSHFESPATSLTEFTEKSHRDSIRWNPFISNTVIQHFSKITFKIPLISHLIYQTVPSLILDITNFLAPSDRASMPSGDQFCSNRVQMG